MGRYSYSQPSEDEPLFGNNDDSGYSETEDLIRRDQAELSLEHEMRARDIHVFQLSEKVDSLTLLPDYDTEEKLRKLEKMVGDLAKEKSCMIKGFECFVIVIVVLVVVIGLLVMLV
ncbi:hypothetical protein YC2023_113344 [Brassica napus]